MTFLRFMAIFLILSLVTTIGIAFFGVSFRQENYWHYHGLLLLFFLAFFPRLALLFSSVPFGGLFWWVGFFFCPRYLIAVVATINYWPNNPFLVTAAWLVALGGESSEKYYVVHKGTRRYRPLSDDRVIDV